MTEQLQNIKDRTAKQLFGQTTDQAHTQGRCIHCKEPALEKCYSEAGRREWRISGLCEPCFDAIMEASDE